MAKDKEDAPAEEEVTAEVQEETGQEETAAEAPAAAPPQRVAVQVDDSESSCSYANFCRVTGSPEELIIDFALNPQPMGVPSEAIDIDQRVVMNYYTAKRLLAALQMSVQRHEAVFGVLETDINKRVASQ
ncbi:MAG: hypothetical protein CMJ82_07845 [Planctomycetaceae bacterium]|nr:hypothetical protein [Planctomycetaceae bacterium]|tara:strand:- start:253 stop:642 length:390 start_codon:yes stop_codon:yes gene_type:complete